MYFKITKLIILLTLLNSFTLTVLANSNSIHQPLEEIKTTNILLSQESNNQLPPLPKPTLLPGPNETNDTDSAQDVLDYTTLRLLPAVSARVVTIIAFLSILSLIYAGTRYYTAFGDEGQADEAKKIIQYSILGLVVSLMSLAIVSIISAFARFFQ